MRSLVTTCMNREHHLRRSLPHWLGLPGIDEIVIVDWSTREPLDDLLVLDERIRLIRVEAEPRWVLTYPYNLGIREASGDIILKCDADCLPSASVAQLVPEPGHFYAGDWRTGTAVGKASVNGQCVFSKAHWLEVNGYHEMLRRYGRDDVDFYDRLVAAGHRRIEIPVADLDFLAHDDAARVSEQVKPAVIDPADDLIHRTLAYHEAINVVIASFHPWGPWYSQAHYETLSDDGRLLRLRRDLSRELPIAAPLAQIARMHGLRAVVTGIGIPAPVAARLDEKGCLGHIHRHLQATTAGRATAA